MVGARGRAAAHRGGVEAVLPSRPQRRGRRRLSATLLAPVPQALQLAGVAPAGDAAAAGRTLQFVGGAHQPAGQRTPARTLQVAGAVAVGRAAQAAQAAAVHGRRRHGRRPFVEDDADHVRRRVDFDALHRRRPPDLRHHLTVVVLDQVRLLQRHLHVVDLDLHPVRVDLDALLVDQHRAHLSPQSNHQPLSLFFFSLCHLESAQIPSSDDRNHRTVFLFS